MSIAYKCECGKQFRAKHDYAGRRVLCPSCKREFRFPVASAPESEVIAVPAPSELLQTQIADEDSPLASLPPLPPQPSSVGIPTPTAIGAASPPPLVHKSAPAPVSDQSRQESANFAFRAFLVLAIIAMMVLCFLGPGNTSGRSTSDGSGWFIAFLLCWILLGLSMLR
jgi:hypothetical protein